MPVIKNGQYADVLVLSSHIGQKNDKLLKDKYYRYTPDNIPYITLYNVRYILKRYEKGLGASYETTGEVLGNETEPYQVENKKLPLLWMRGREEIRQKDEETLTIDGGCGWIVEATKNNNGKNRNEKVVYSESVIMTKAAREKVYKILWQ
ncbi:hypothetical protein [Paenibacillus chitinolyticus]|uniref:hypothetical protein n=1 Tax=Paenibacillus chitinolyticus TaxID=79263 RepID=UPI0036711B2F